MCGVKNTISSVCPCSLLDDLNRLPSKGISPKIGILFSVSLSFGHISEEKCDEGCELNTVPVT